MDPNFYANYVCMSLAEFEAFINCNFRFLKQDYFSIFYYKMDNYVTLLHAKNWTFFGFLFLDSRVHQQLMLLLPPFMITSFTSFIELRNHLGRWYNNTTVHTWFNAQASVVAPGLRSVTETGHAGQGDGYIYTATAVKYRPSCMVVLPTCRFTSQTLSGKEGKPHHLCLL